MSDVYDAVWPEELVRSLWNFDALSPETDRVIPFMGLAVEPWFLFYFALGGIVIAAMAFQRFDERFPDDGSRDWRVLQTLTPKTLRGRSAIRRAYSYYISILLVTYTVLTFFGGLIAEVFSAFAVAGVQIETGNLNFENHAWPIALSAGFAGLGPLLPPLAALERRLRLWAHQTVGIPVQVMRNTDDILSRLEQDRPPPIPALKESGTGGVRYWQVSDGPHATDTLRICDWVRTHLGSEIRFHEFLQQRQQLRILLDWHDVRGARWPRPSVRQEVGVLEEDLIAEASVTLNELDKLLEIPFVPAALLNQDSDRHGRDKLQVHQQELKQSLDKHRATIGQLRDELAAVLAVYGERDPGFAKIDHDEGDQDDERTRLVQTLQKVFPRKVNDGNPQSWMAMCLVPIFFVYLVMTQLGLNSLMGSVKPTSLTLSVTAALETLRLAILFLLPVAVAFGWRHHRLEARHEGRWLPLVPGAMDSRHYRQLATCLSLALGVTLAGLVALAVFWAALLADDASDFVEILLTRSYILYYYVGQILVSAVFVTVVLLAADAEGNRSMRRDMAAGHRWMRRGRRVVTFAALAGIGVALAWLVHLTIWYVARGWGWPSCTGEYSYFMNFVSDPICFQRYGLGSLTIYVGLAALAAGPFISSPSRRRYLALRAPVSASASTSAAVAGCLLAGLAVSGSAAAQGAAERGEVVLGFRADAEPFSYRVAMHDHGAADGPPVRYRGYIADLCNWIFSEGPYQARAVEVEAGDRRSRLRKPDWFAASEGQSMAQAASLEPENGGPVDVLCDPLTLRYHASDGSERPLALYSPIVFVSGVSYLHRREGARGGDVLLAYVENTTASEVAKRACRANKFGISATRWDGGCGPSGGSPPGDVRLQTAERCAPIRDGHDATDAAEEHAYIFCEAESHDQLIEWFCASPSDDQAAVERVYFGDIDIIRAKHRAFERQADCAADGVKQTFTYEPYALAVTADDPELFQFVQQRVYEFFSHRGDPVGEFAEYFQENMSRPLAWLFLLNAVDHVDNFTAANVIEDGAGQSPDASPGSAGRSAAREDTGGDALVQADP